jgi:hypothetical protein
MAVSLGVKGLGVVPNLIEAHLELRRRLVDIELVHRFVGGDHREAVDVSLLGNALRLLDAGRRDAGRNVLLRRLADGVVVPAAGGQQRHHQHADQSGSECVACRANVRLSHWEEPRQGKNARI